MSENLSHSAEYPDVDPYIQGQIDQYLAKFENVIQNGDAAIFKGLTDQGEMIDFAVLKWQVSEDFTQVEIARRMRALRLVRYLSKTVFNPKIEGDTRKIDLGTIDESMWHVDQFCGLYLQVEAVKQGGEFLPFDTQEVTEPHSTSRQVIASFRGYDIHKKAIIVEGWQQIHSTYLAAPISQREAIRAEGF